MRAQEDKKRGNQKLNVEWEHTCRAFAPEGPEEATLLTWGVSSSASTSCDDSRKVHLEDINNEEKIIYSKKIGNSTE